VRADSDVTVGSRAFSPEVAEPVVDDFDPYNGYDPSRDAATTGPEQITETRRQRRASSR
jgi:hypothetical protein